MNKYLVLWFDDEHESLETLKDDALNFGIVLKGYKNADDGLYELEHNPEYDAVIVDGLFFNSRSHTGDAVDNSAFGRVAFCLKTMKEKGKIIPWFIFSGQPSFIKERNDLVKILADKDFGNGKVYDKNSDEDFDELCGEIIKSAGKIEDTRLKHKYANVFAVCTKKYIGPQATSDLLTILKNDNIEHAPADSRLFFNPLRKIMDDLFIACNKYGLLPDVFVKPSIALNESSKFLSGSAEKGYQLDLPVFPKVVSDNVRNILAVCQPGSHRSEIDSFVTEVNSSYLLLSCTYQLFDVLLWFKAFIDKNEDIESNRSRIKKVNAGTEAEILIGFIEQDELKNYHCGEILITYKHIKEMNYQVGDKIRVIKIVTNSNDKTMHLYQKCAMQSEKL